MALYRSMAETTNADINHFFGMDSISKSGKTTQRLKGLRLRPKSLHRCASSSRMGPPAVTGSPIRIRKAENGVPNAPSSHKDKVRSAVPLGDLENKMHSMSISKKTPRCKVGTGKKMPAAARGGDRFIPNRSINNMEQGSFLLSGRADHLSPGTQDYQDFLLANVTSENPQKRVLALTVGESTNRTTSMIRTPHELSRTADFSYLKSSAKVKRAIPTEEEQILDAPGVLDDYYLNLVDWSRSNVLAIALHNLVYLWNADDGSVQELCKVEGEEAYVSSLAWGKNGSYLAIGTSKRELAIWDINKMKRLRVMGDNAERIGSLSWRQHMVTSGGRDGSIKHHDVRAKQHVTEVSVHHRMEVCGLKWSRDGAYMVSGSNDNHACVWSHGRLRDPIHVLEHSAAVKGMAWCPSQNSLLATGGGSADQCLRLWNVLDGTCQKSAKTESQVTSIVWSKSNQELLTGHGGPDYQLTIWNEDLVKQADIKGHNGRILKVVKSPCGTLVASLSADETLRVWKCFDSLPDASKSCLDSFSMCSTIR